MAGQPDASTELTPAAEPATIVTTSRPALPDGAVAWAEMRLRTGRRVHITSHDSPAERSTTGWIVAQLDTSLRLRLASAHEAHLPPGLAWRIDVGRTGDARYRLQCHLRSHAPATDGAGREVIVEVLAAERVQTRSEARVPYEGRVGIVLYGGEWPRLGWLDFRDLSPSGLGGRCSIPLAIGDELIARLRLPTFQVPLGFRARAVRVVPEPADATSGHDFGAIWVAPTALFRRVVRRYVAAQLRADTSDDPVGQPAPRVEPPGAPLGSGARN